MSWTLSDFQVGKPIGKGRYGNVYVAKEKKSKKVVALKVLFIDQLQKEGVLHTAKREIEIHTRYVHTDAAEGRPKGGAGAVCGGGAGPNLAHRKTPSEPTPLHRPHIEST